MTTDIERHGGSALAVHQDQQYWTDNQLSALQQLNVDTNSPGDLAVFFHQAQATGLDPFKREIYMITRKGKPTIQTGIDGFYKIADRVTTRTRGTWGITETYWCGPDGQWVDVWLQKGAPAAAKVVVERNGSKFTTVALTSEYTASGPMWQKMPARMIAKCAEALAIRKAFPEDLSGLYTSDEMAQADQSAPQAPIPRQRRQVRQTNRAPQEPSGRDWWAEMEDCETSQQLRDLYTAARQAGELTDELKNDIATVGSVLAQAERDAEQDPVQAEITGEFTS